MSELRVLFSDRLPDQAVEKQCIERCGVRQRSERFGVRHLISLVVDPSVKKMGLSFFVWCACHPTVNVELVFTHGAPDPFGTVLTPVISRESLKWLAPFLFCLVLTPPSPFSPGCMHGPDGVVLRDSFVKPDSSHMHVAAHAVSDAFNRYQNLETVCMCRADAIPVLSVAAFEAEVGKGDRFGLVDKEMGGFEFYSRAQDFCIT